MRADITKTGPPHALRCEWRQGDSGMRLVAALIVVTALGCALHATANADPITFAYFGHLTQISTLDPASPFPQPISDDPSNPTAFQGSFTFDSLATDEIPADPSTGAYHSAGGANNFRLFLGGLSFTFGDVNIGVLNDYPFPLGDQYQAGHFENPTDANPTGVQVYFQLTDLSANAFSTDALPLDPPDVGMFTFTYFFFTDTIDGNQVEVAGVIDSLKAAPEPPSLALLATGLLLAAGLQRLRALRANRA